MQRSVGAELFIFMLAVFCGVSNLSFHERSRHWRRQHGLVPQLHVDILWCSVCLNLARPRLNAASQIVEPL